MSVSSKASREDRGGQEGGLKHGPQGRRRHRVKQVSQLPARWDVAGSRLMQTGNLLEKVLPPCVSTTSQDAIARALSCPTLCDPMDCNLPGSSVHRICQARLLEWVAISYSRDLPDPGMVSCIAGGFFTTETPGKPNLYYRVSHYLDFAHQIPMDSETCFSVKVVVRMGFFIRF